MRHHTFSKLYRAAIALFACLILACAAAVVAFYVAPKSSLAEADTRAAAHTYQVDSDFDIAETDGKVARPDTSSSGGGDSYNKIVKGLKAEKLEELKGNSGDIEIVIPDGVQAIAERAFKNASTNGGNAVYANITSVTIPNTVQYIGPEAFFGLSKLKTITFKDGGEESLTICGNGTYSGGSIASGSANLSGAFSGCSAVTELVVPDRTTAIGIKAFENFTSLTSYKAPFAGGKFSASPDSSTQLHYIFGGNNTGMSSNSYSYYYVSDESTSQTRGVYSSVPNSLKTVEITGGSNKGADAASGVMSGAFYNMSLLTKVILPENIKTIHAGTFEGCSGLQTVENLTKAEAIYYKAFNGCSKLEGADLSSVKTLGDPVNGDIFSSCTSLENVTMPTAGLERIPVNAFSGCTKLVKLTIPSSVTQIGAGAFSSSGIQNVNIPESVTTLSANVFNNCKGLSNIALPNGLTTIENNAFSSSAITSIETHDNLTSIGASAFASCSSLHTVKLNKGLQTIGASAFSQCSNLININLEEGLQTIGASAFYNCGNSSFTKLTIPSSVTEIGDSAFRICYYLFVNINDGSNITSIGSNAFESTKIQSITLGSSCTSIGSSAFKSCSQLHSADLSETKISAIKDSTFNGCSNLYNLSLPATFERSGTATIGASAFNGCSSLNELTLPANLETIGSSAFNSCSGLRQLTIPGSVTSIGNNAFSGCSSLNELTLPESLETIGNSAFSSCSKIKTITIPASVESFKTGVPTSVFSGCSALESVTFECDFTRGVGNSLFNGCSNLAVINFKKQFTPDSIGNNAFQSTKIGEFKIPESVTSIGDYAFYGCSKLQLLADDEGRYLPAGLTKLGNYAFENCTALTDINIPEGITSISRELFSGCTELQNVTFDNVENITSFGMNSFYNCKSLQSIVLPSNITSLNSNYIFSGCTNLKSVTYGGEPAEEGAVKLPASINTMGTDVFRDCQSITKVYWAEGLAAMPNDTFYGCTSLQEVIFPEDMVLTKIGDSAFYGCVKLTTVTFPNGKDLTTIGGSAFSGCIDYVTFDFTAYDNLSIGASSFYGCQFETLDLSKVKSIGSSAIGGNSKLRELTVSYVGTSATKVSGSDSNLIYLFGSSNPSSSSSSFYRATSHYQTNDNVTSVSTNYGYIPIVLKTINLVGYNKLADGSGILPTGAFEGFKQLTAINFIDPNLNEIRDYAFAGCEQLRKLEIPSNVTVFKSSNTSVAHFFENCKGLQELTIPFINVSNITKRQDLAVMFGVTNADDGLGAYNLNKIELTNTETLGNNAFRNATNLKTIILPENMTSIADGALAGCTDLEELTLPFLGLNEASSETATLATVFGGTVPANLTNLTLRGGNIGAGAFEGSHLESVTLPANLSAIPERAFKDCGNLTQIGIQPDSKILTIGDYAFAGCSALSALSLSSSVTTIGAHAFENCVNLSEFTIPANAQKLGEYAFKGCISLDSVDLKNVVDMGARAFENCTALKNVTLSTALTKIEEGVFAGCTLLKSVKYTGGNGADVVLPSGVTEVGDYAFDRCNSIESVSLSTDLKTIGRYAFTDNAALRILIIPAGVKTISVNAFQNCSALEFIYLPDNANYGTNAFSNLPQSATLIASNKGVYDTIIKQSKLPKEQITYLIPITYHKIMQDGTDSADIAESRLYKKDFAYTRNDDGSWSEKAGIEVNRPMRDYVTTVWRISNKSNAAQATVESVNALLSGGTERIDLYAKFYATSDFKPKTLSGIVYGDVPVLELANARPADIVNYINSNLLNIDVDDDATVLKSDILRVVGWQYTPVGGRMTTEPAAVGNAGSYQIELNLVSSLGAWQDNIQINVTIDRKKIAADMDWAYSKPDADTGESELQYLNDFTGEIDGANKDFKNASVQGDGSTIAVGPDAVIMNEVPQTPSGKAIYTDFVPEKENYPNFGTKPGRHDTKIRLTFTERENYEFITALSSDELTKRNLSIDINGTEGYVTITKIWYIIQWDNYTDDGKQEGGWTSGTITIDPPTITDEDGEEWTMPLRWTFGTSPNVSKPIVKNKGGDVLANPQITFAILSNSSASVAARATSQLVEFGYLEFEQWINKAVPAGEYTLTLHADQNVWGTALDKSYRFSVKAKTFDTADLFKENGGEYEFKYDGSIKLPEVSLSVPEIADLRSGTGWEDEQFEDYYSTGYDITYSVNHSKFMTEDEIIEELGGMLVNVLRDDNNEVIAYDVYYRISAANYATVGGTTATYKFTIKVIPGDFQFKTEYYRPDWTEGEPASEEPVLTPLEAFDNGDFSYTIKYFTDEDCTEEYTESTFKVGKYYVKVYVPEASNWNAHESKYEFEVLPRATIAPEPTIHRQAGLGSPNGFSLTTPATLNMRILTIVLIVVGIVILLAILLLIFILAWRAHKRRKELFERIMNITSKPISAYLPPQYGNGLPYTASAEAIAALPVTAGDVAAADEEDTDPDGFYDHFVSQEDIDAVFGKMTMPFGRNSEEETQQETTTATAETAETAEPATDGNDAQNAGGEGNEE